MNNTFLSAISLFGMNIAEALTIQHGSHLLVITGMLILSVLSSCMLAAMLVRLISNFKKHSSAFAVVRGPGTL